MAVGASLLVVLGRNPMHSVLLLIVSFAALAGLYIGLDAPFAAVVQIIIYAGAIMVLFLFVVMLLNAHREDDAAPPAAGDQRAAARGRGAGRAAGRGTGLGAEAGRAWRRRVAVGRRRAPTRQPCSRSARWATVLFTDYSLAFEVTSILIIVAMVGAVVLAKRES